MSFWTSKKTQEEHIFVLALDGGGIRGLLPLAVLQELEKRILTKGKTDTFSQIFHLIAGSGSGALSALALSTDINHPLSGAPLYRGMTPKELIEAYQVLGKEIFPPGVFRTIGQAFTGKYSPAKLEEVLKMCFQDTKLQDTHTNLLIPAYKTIPGTAHLFGSSGKRGALALQGDEDYLIRDIARATTAAPSYFPPAFIQAAHGKSLPFLDGSIVANNPALIAYQTALQLYPNATAIHILSLGTGTKPSRLSHRQIKDWGYLDWVNPARKVPLIDIHQSAQQSLVDISMQLMPKASYYRIEMPLEHDFIAIDDASESAIKKLDRLGNMLIKNHDQVLTEFVEAL